MVTLETTHEQLRADTEAHLAAPEGFNFVSDTL